MTRRRRSPEVSVLDHGVRRRIAGFESGIVKAFFIHIQVLCSCCDYVNTETHVFQFKNINKKKTMCHSYFFIYFINICKWYVLALSVFVNVECIVYNRFLSWSLTWNSIVIRYGCVLTLRIWLYQSKILDPLERAY